MKSSEYWKRRFELLEQAANQKGVQCYADIEAQYRKAQRQIEGQIAAWYQRFADNNGVTLADAKRMLTAKELAELKWDIQDYIRYGEENAINGIWIKQLENASARYHISRLEALKLQTQQLLEVMFGNQLDSIDSTMREVYKSGYYHTAYEIQKGVGVGWDFTALDEKKISKVINKPWAVDGKNFSERIWGNRQKLVNELNTTLTQNIILGKDPQKAIDELARKMNTSKVNAGRLVMTEEAFFSSAAQKDCFAELEVEQYEIVATLDSHTSEICQDMDGKHFPMSQWEVGVTAPPFHVWCRSTTIPYFDDEFTSVGKRAARGSDGKTYYVPADMTYKQWGEEFVKNTTRNAQYLFQTHKGASDISREKQIVDEAVTEMPKKVREKLEDGTIIDIGKIGASQYDYDNDILYVAKKAEKGDIVHEIGHLVENKMLNSETISQVRKQIIGEVDIWDIKTETFYDNENNPVEIFLLESDKFVSQYQGRIYAETIWDAFDEDGNFRYELMMEFISEPFREYIENPKLVRDKCKELYDLIEEAVK